MSFIFAETMRVEVHDRRQQILVTANCAPERRFFSALCVRVKIRLLVIHEERIGTKRVILQRLSVASRIKHCILQWREGFGPSRFHACWKRRRRTREDACGVG